MKVTIFEETGAAEFIRIEKALSNGRSAVAFLGIIFYLFLPALSFSQNIKKIPVSPGCEDFALDTLGQHPRLIISCDDRWNSKTKQGFIYMLDIETQAVRPFHLSGLNTASFHPHGISLVEREGKKLLYVISHSNKKQSIEKRNYTDVFIFDVGKDTLTLIDNIGGPKYKQFATPNDLVALESGEVFMTNSLSMSKSVLYYSPSSPKWQKAAGGFIFANGIFVRKNKVYINSTIGGKQFVFDHLGEGKLTNKTRIARKLGSADNILENSNGDLTFGAPFFFGFARYTLNHKYSPRSRVLRIRDSWLEELRLDGIIPIPSVALEYNDTMYVGQIYEDSIAIIQNPEWKFVKSLTSLK